MINHRGRAHPSYRSNPRVKAVALQNSHVQKADPLVLTGLIAGVVIALYWIIGG